MLRKVFICLFVGIAYGLYAQAPENSLKTIKISLSTGHPIHIMEPCGAKAPELLIENLSDIPGSFSVKLKIESFGGKSYSRKCEIQIPEKGQSGISLDHRFDELGLWNILFVITDNKNGGGTEGKLSFAVMSPAGNKTRNNEFIFSLCSHPLRDNPEQQKLEALAASLIGISCMRVDGNWEQIQPREGSWNFDRFDKMLEIFTSYDISLMPVLSNTPKWAVAKDAQGVYHKRTAHYRNLYPDSGAWIAFVKKIVSRYKGRINYYEVWNEPDLHFANFSYDEYLKMLRSTYASIKSVDPQIKVFNGGLSSVAIVPVKGNCMGRTISEGRNDFDILAIHAHATQDAYRQKLAKMFEQMKKQKFGKPWFSHESGFSSTGGQDKLQALSLYKKFIYTWASGGMGYTWYDLRNDGYDRYNREHHFGLLTRDFYPKAAYVVYNTISSLFNRAVFKQPLLDDGKNYSYLFKTPTGFLVAGWTESGTFPLFAATDAQSAEIVDLMGNTYALKIDGGRVIIPHGEQPMTIRFNQASTFVPGGSLIALDGMPLVIGGRDTKLKFRLFNPFNDQQEFRFKIGDRIQSTKVNSREKKQFEVTVPQELCQSKRLKIEYKLRSSGLRGMLEIPLSSCKVISGVPHSAPDIVLDRAEQRHELYPDNPHMMHMTWKGPTDVSAQMRLSLKDDNLVFDAEVCDDRHIQKNHGSDVWRGDNIQTSFFLPGWHEACDIGFTHYESGPPEVFIWNKPAGIALEAKDIRLETSRHGTKTLYHAEIPLRKFGVTKFDLKKGFKFNVIVNDDDGDGRKGWMQLAPGLGSKTQGIGAGPMVIIE